MGRPRAARIATPVQNPQRINALTHENPSVLHFSPARAARDAGGDVVRSLQDRDKTLLGED
jgi:hypothetical protein